MPRGWKSHKLEEGNHAVCGELATSMYLTTVWRLVTCKDCKRKEA